MNHALAQNIARDADLGLDGLYRKIAFRLLPFLCCCLMAAALDRINISFAKLQMQDDLALSDAVYGLGAGIFFLGYVVFEVPSNAILQRVGARIWIGRIMISWGVISGMMAFVTTPAQFHILRFLLGVAEAGCLPGILFYLTSWFPAARRGRVTGFLMLGAPLSSLLGAPLSGWIMRVFDDVRGFAGWQWLFMLEALPSIALGFVALLLLPKAPARAQWLSEAEKRALAADLACHEAQDHQGSSHRFRDGILDRRVWVLGGIDFSILLTAYAISFWMPSLLRDAGIVDLRVIGLLTAVPSAAGILGLLLLTASSDRHRERRYHIIIPFLVAALGLACSTLVLNNAPALVLCFTVATMMVTGTMGVFFTLPATFLKGPAAAAGFALACSLANIAGLVSNGLMGLVISIMGDARGALLFFSICLLGSSLLVRSLPPALVNK